MWKFNIGFILMSFLMCLMMFFLVLLVFLLRSWTTSFNSSSGKNSWSGGSRRWMVIGKLFMVWKMFLKLFCWNGNSVLSVVLWEGVFLVMIIWRTVRMRSLLLKNMCFVRMRLMFLVLLVCVVVVFLGVLVFVSIFMLWNLLI